MAVMSAGSFYKSFISIHKKNKLNKYMGWVNTVCYRQFTHFTTRRGFAMSGFDKRVYSYEEAMAGIESGMTVVAGG
ncbi:MAG: hypothetical protein LPK20_02980, partial [Halomonas sp.]|nr:hypothetical protein [Halomonas sp.]